MNWADGAERLVQVACECLAGRAADAGVSLSGQMARGKFFELIGRFCMGQFWRLKHLNWRMVVHPGLSLYMAIKHALTRKSYWRLSRTPAMRYAMPNKWLHEQGLLSLKQL